MTSQVDATIPSDNTQVSKAELRANYRIIRDEISALQRKTRMPHKIAFNNDENGV